MTSREQQTNRKPQTNNEQQQSGFPKADGYERASFPKATGHRTASFPEEGSSLSPLPGTKSTYFIADIPTFRQAVALLAAPATHVGIDTERASGFTYAEELCLLQIWHPQGIFLFDALALKKQWAGLSNPPAASPGIYLNQALQDKTWIIHSAVDDLPVLNDWDLFAPQLYDTRLAADFLNIAHTNLGNLVKMFLGIEILKAHQKENWSRRPLPESWLKYAAEDVKYLYSLYQATAQALGNKLEWAQASFVQLLSKTYTAKPVVHWEDTPGIAVLKTPLSVQVFKNLYLKRDGLAQQANIAPGRILSRKTMVKLAQVLPRSWQEYLAFCDQEAVLPRRRKAFWQTLFQARQRYHQSKSSARKQTPGEVDHDVKAFLRNRKPRLQARTSFFSKKQKAYLACLNQYVAQLSQDYQVKPHLLLSMKQSRALIGMDFTALTDPDLSASSAEPSQADIPLIPALEQLGLDTWAIDLFRPLEPAWDEISRSF